MASLAHYDELFGVEAQPDFETVTAPWAVAS